VRLIALSLFGLSLSACAGSPQYTSSNALSDESLLTEDRRKFMVAELNSQREIWVKNTPKNYTYSISNHCFCPRGYETGPNNIRVKNHQIVSVIFQEDSKIGYIGNPRDRSDYKLDNSIVEMFDLVGKILEPNGDNSWSKYKDREVYFAVKYDKIMGFPIEISHHIEDIIDGG